ncbi:MULTISPECIES: hypothetical protein [Halomonadaceae]|uniref:Uncharacterized protein n=1 Tax=Vreelandella sp. SM1641 TaxID=3126101 RepID=A0AAU7XJ84_9GAMM|nr:MULTISPECIES: hypothetical protein [Halomonadaceae]MDQ7730299.1 hypothetical protein [Halomonas sp. SpR8]MEA2116949.1 hypothetical protein [Halovibrio sp. HP20-59]CAD5293695.1 conserved hypothetical protein [Halomonas sp. 156]CDG53757.1 exported hypothetical protein [Halomonas sp. A3H3]
MDIPPVPRAAGLSAAATLGSYGCEAWYPMGFIMPKHHMHNL